MPFWSFPNPIGKKGKELCDVLVICKNTIIIISVKEIATSENISESVQYKRWLKKAILASANQIYGAERFIETTDEIILKDNKSKIKLPEKQNRTIYRIAIAFGSKNDYPLLTGDLGKGFIHVFDEESTFTIFNELDTITDFTSYLAAKEQGFDKKRLISSNEVDFLAFYLQGYLDIDYPTDMIVLQINGFWKDYVKSAEYMEWKEDIEASYIWDEVITQLYENYIFNKKINGSTSELKENIRAMNLESRMNRIVLGENLIDAIKNNKTRTIKLLDNSNHFYVFMPLNDENWNVKESILELRCLVAKSEHTDREQVIGLSIGSNSKGGKVFDIYSIIMSEMTDEFIRRAKK